MGILLENLLGNNKKNVTLQCVFHGIRFILRLVRLLVAR